MVTSIPLAWIPYWTFEYHRYESKKRQSYSPYYCELLIWRHHSILDYWTGCILARPVYMYRVLIQCRARSSKVTIIRCYKKISFTWVILLAVYKINIGVGVPQYSIARKEGQRPPFLSSPVFITQFSKHLQGLIRVNMPQIAASMVQKWAFFLINTKGTWS